MEQSERAQNERIHTLPSSHPPPVVIALVISFKELCAFE